MENPPKFNMQLKGDEKSLLAFVRMKYWVDVRNRIAGKVGKDGRIAYSDALQILEEPTNGAVKSFYESLGSGQNQAILVLKAQPSFEGEVSISLIEEHD